MRLLGDRKAYKTIRLFNGGVGFQFIKEVRLFDRITFTSRMVGHDRCACMVVRVARG